MTHWQVSVAINRLLCGRAGQPLCARVYMARPSIWRSAYLIAADLAFGEYRHCERIWLQWKMGRP